MSKRVGWCILRDSAKVRAAIEVKIKQKRLTITELGRISGVPQNKISMWRTGRSNGHGVTQREMLQILDSLGLEVDIKVEFT